MENLGNRTVVNEIPPSSSRVAVRTMASDLASIGESGGLSSAPEGVSVLHKENIPAPPEKSHVLAWAMAITAVLITLFLIGFFLLPRFL